MGDIMDVCSRVLNSMPLFDEPVAHARTTDRVTSHMAAASVTNIRESQQTILYCLKQFGPLCDEDIYKFVRQGMSPSGARSRRAECVAKGWVVDSGERGTTTSGRKTILWKACS